jgi:hypothetical protein
MQQLPKRGRTLPPFLSCIMSVLCQYVAFAAVTVIMFSKEQLLPVSMFFLVLLLSSSLCQTLYPEETFLDQKKKIDRYLQIGNRQCDLIVIASRELGFQGQNSLYSVVVALLTFMHDDNHKRRSLLLQGSDIYSLLKYED